MTGAGAGHRAVRRHRAGGAGFTLTELLVVIVVVVILLTIAVPSLQSMYYSAESNSAFSQLSAGLAAGRAAAIRSTGDADGAAVFAFEPGGRLRVYACERVGRVLDQKGTGSVLRDVYVPVDSIAPVSLPIGWMVRGYAPPFTVDDEWYEGGGRNRRYGEGYSADPARGDWVFPETGFFDARQRLDGGVRQSFMVRFAGGTGEVRGAGDRAAIVVLPRGSTENGWTESWRNAGQAEDLRRWVQRVLSDRSLSASERAEILGDRSADTVLVRSVSLLALADERVLGRALGVRPDRVSGSLYTGDATGRYQNGPRFLRGVTGDRIAQWIQGDSDIDGRYGEEADVPGSRIYVVDRVSGELREVSQLNPG